MNIHEGKNECVISSFNWSSKVVKTSQAPQPPHTPKTKKTVTNSIFCCSHDRPFKNLNFLPIALEKVPRESRIPSAAALSVWNLIPQHPKKTNVLDFEI